MSPDDISQRRGACLYVPACADTADRSAPAYRPSGAGRRRQAACCARCCRCARIGQGKPCPYNQDNSVDMIRHDDKLIEFNAGETRW